MTRVGAESSLLLLISPTTNKVFYASPPPLFAVINITCIYLHPLQSTPTQDGDMELEHCWLLLITHGSMSSITCELRRKYLTWLTYLNERRTCAIPYIRVHLLFPAFFDGASIETTMGDHVNLLLASATVRDASGQG